MVDKPKKKQVAKSNPVRAYYIKLEYMDLESDTVKRLRKKCGDAGAIVYLKLLTKYLPDNAIFSFDKSDGDTLAESVAYSINETDTQCVECAIEWLRKKDMLLQIDNEDGYGGDDREYFHLPNALEKSGQLTASGVRMRIKRLKDSQLSQGDGIPSQSDTNVTDIKKKENKTKEDKSYSHSHSELSSLDLIFDGLTPDGAAGEARAAGSAPFGWDDIVESNERNGFGLNDELLKGFQTWMESTDWTISGEPVVKLDNALKGYAKKHKPKETSKEQKAQPKDPVAEAREEFYRIFASYVPKDVFEKYGSPILVLSNDEEKEQVAYWEEGKEKGDNETFEEYLDQCEWDWEKEIVDSIICELAKAYIPKDALKVKVKLREFYKRWIEMDGKNPDHYLLEEKPQKESDQQLKSEMNYRDRKLNRIIDGKGGKGAVIAYRILTNEEYDQIMKYY